MTLQIKKRQEGNRISASTVPAGAGGVQDINERRGIKTGRQECPTHLDIGFHGLTCPRSNRSKSLHVKEIR